MEKIIDKETEFISLLAELICGTEDVIDTKATAYAKRLPCSKPALGKWIDECDFPVLMETLALSDQVFRHEFPEIKVGVYARTSFAGLLEAHCNECRRCEAKRTDDLAWQARMEKAIAENKEVFGKALARAVGKG